jgi:hypothetical protein
MANLPQSFLDVELLRLTLSTMVPAIRTKAGANRTCRNAATAARSPEVFAGKLYFDASVAVRFHKSDTVVL